MPGVFPRCYIVPILIGMIVHGGEKEESVVDIAMATVRGYLKDKPWKPSRWYSSSFALQ